MRKIKNIHVVLENCEVFEVPAESIDLLIINGIKTQILINAYQYENGETMEHQNAEYIHLSIFKSGELKDLTEMGNGNDINRLHRHNDITQIELNYDDEESIGYYVPWGEHDYTNEYQKSEFKNNYYGKEILDITIEKDK